MTVEQTTQLIALMLNAILMALLGGLLWGVAWSRRHTLQAQLQETQRLQQVLFVNARPNRELQLQRLRQQQQRQRRQFQLAYGSVVVSHYTLTLLLFSVLLLGLRMLIFSNALISLALLLFVLGAAGLLLGVLLLLVDAHQAPVLGSSLLDWLRRTVLSRFGGPSSATVKGTAIARFTVPLSPSFEGTLPRTGTER